MAQTLSYQGLQDYSFKGHDLSDPDYSYADIRWAYSLGAILTTANFSDAIAGLQRFMLNHTDVKAAILTRTNWLQAQKLNYPRHQGTYLEDITIQQLANAIAPLKSPLSIMTPTMRNDIKKGVYCLRSDTP